MRNQGFNNANGRLRAVLKQVGQNVKKNPLNLINPLIYPTAARQVRDREQAQAVAAAAEQGAYSGYTQAVNEVAAAGFAQQPATNMGVNAPLGNQGMPGWAWALIGIAGTTAVVGAIYLIVKK